MPGDFSPDGTQFVFVRVSVRRWSGSSRDADCEIRVGTIGEEGTVAITIPGFAHPFLPGAHWSPDGEWILFGGSSGLHVSQVRPDGTDRQTIPVATPSLDAFLYRPDWSPDGVADRVLDGPRRLGADSELYSVAADGSDLRGSRTARGARTTRAGARPLPDPAGPGALRLAGA